MQHLAHHGVTLNDLTAHLGEVHETHVAAAPDALRHAAARAQRAEAAQRAADEMNVRLLASVEALRRQVRVTWTVVGVLGGGALLAAAVVLGVQAWQAREPATSVQQIAPRISDAVTNPAAPAPAAADAGARHSGEWVGTVLQPAELLDDQDSAAQRRAMLDAGARVLVLQSGPVWLRVRTERGDGYVLKGLVRADR